MLSNKNKFLIYTSIFFSLILLGISLRAYLSPLIGKSAQEQLIFCDVGQGDAILYVSSSTQVLIDAGNTDARVMQCLRKYMPLLDKKLEIIIATHPDQDHIGGLEAVLSQYEVDDFIMPPYLKETKVFKSLLNKLSHNMREKKTRLLFCPTQLSYTLSSNSRLKFWSYFEEMNKFCPIISPEDNIVNLWDYLSGLNLINIDENMLSIVSILSVDDKIAFLPGDLEMKGELSLMKSGLLEPVTILKVAHHGSNSSTSSDFIHVLKPENSVISVGVTNRYGHPTARVIELLSKYRSKLLRTDLLGDIIFQILPNSFLLLN